MQEVEIWTCVSGSDGELPAICWQTNPGCAERHYQLAYHRGNNPSIPVDRSHHVTQLRRLDVVWTHAHRSGKVAQTCLRCFCEWAPSHCAHVSQTPSRRAGWEKQTHAGTSSPPHPPHQWWGLNPAETFQSHLLRSEMSFHQPAARQTSLWKTAVHLLNIDCISAPPVHHPSWVVQHQPCHSSTDTHSTHQPHKCRSGLVGHKSAGGRWFRCHVTFKVYSVFTYSTLIKCTGTLTKGRHVRPWTCGFSDEVAKRELVCAVPGSHPLRCDCGS